MANDTYWNLRIEKSAIERDFCFLNFLEASEVQCGLKFTGEFGVALSI